MNSSLEAAIGLKTVVELDNRGSQLSSRLEGAGSIDQALAQTMEQTMVAEAPLPLEAVGPGAKWELVQPIEVSGITAIQTTTFTLVEVNGSEISLEVESDQEVELGSVLEVTPGIGAVITEWDVQNEGTAKWDLTKFSPSAESQVALVQSMEFVDGPTSRTEMNMTMTMRPE